MNIIFDLCGVILEWKPDQIINKFFDSPETRKLAKEQILFHPDWANLDRGTMIREEAIRRAALRTGFTFDEIDRMVAHIPGSLLPVPETVQVVKKVKEKGHRMFSLTNIPIFSMEYVENAYPFFSLFEEVIASCRVHMIKPEPDIYKFTLEKYGLQTEDTIFIDDSKNNIDTAVSLGIRSIHFKDPVQLEEELICVGCL